MTNFGACILSCDGPRLSADETALFKEIRPFGFILFARHIESVSQVRALCDELRASVERDCIITIDQEGGRVQRLRGPTWRDWQPPLEHIATASESVRAMFLRARVIAHELHGLGIDSNCIPTLDVIQPNTHPFLVNRCYGETVDGVIAAGRATAEGLLAGGIVPVMKHIPGHGRSQFDTHFDVPTVLTDRAALEAVDFAPFAALRDLPMGMTAHLIYAALDPRPSTLSPIMVDLIRNEIGFDGLLMTDDISMQALSGTLADRAKAALAAGCDVVLHCNDTFAQRVEVAQACGQMTDAGQARALKAMAARLPPQPFEIDAAEAELATLMGGKVYV